MNIESEMELRRLRGNPTEIERVVNQFEEIVDSGVMRGLVERNCKFVRMARRLFWLMADVLKEEPIP